MFCAALEQFGSSSVTFMASSNQAFVRHPAVSGAVQGDRTTWVAAILVCTISHALHTLLSYLNIYRALKTLLYLTLPTYCQCWSEKTRGISVHVCIIYFLKKDVHCRTNVIPIHNRHKYFTHWVCIHTWNPDWGQLDPLQNLAQC